MRALCGAIITAGALIGLGLATMGIGYRYYMFPYLDQDGNPQRVMFWRLDPALLVAILALLICVAIGLGITFVGLAYHHHRRLHEMMLRHEARRPGPPPPAEPRPADRVSV